MNVLLVDDHRVVRVAIHRLLRSALPALQVTEADSGQAALTQCAEHRFDAVVLDIGLPDLSGLEVARRLLQRHREVRILFFSMHDELPMVRQALAVGGLGFVSKNCDQAVLVAAVERVAAGEPYIEHSVATRLALNHQHGADQRLQEMTQRELEVLVMYARGEPVAGIARRLCVSDKTISNHLALIKNKLQVRSAVDLIHLAVDSGLVRYGERTLAYQSNGQAVQPSM